MKRKIAVITGTRAEYGLLRPVIREIKRSPRLTLSLVVAGMHLDKEFGNTIGSIRQDGYPIANKVKMNPKSDAPGAMASAVGTGILGMTKAFKTLKPDVVLILGDRIEALAAAIAAVYMNIIVGHIHGGDVSQGFDESARHAITKFAHLHFTASRVSKKRILKMGEKRKNVFLVGAPGLDSIMAEEIVPKSTLLHEYGIDADKPFILVLQHPVTTQIAQAGEQMLITMSALRKLGLPTVLIYPNSDSGGRKMIEVIEKNRHLSFLKIFRSLPHNVYLALLKYAAVLIGNSSSGMIESACFELPVINLGIRQKGRERSANVIDVDHDRSKIVKAVKKAMKDGRFRSKLRKCRSPYGDGQASRKIVKVLENVKLGQGLLQKELSY